MGGSPSTGGSAAPSPPAASPNATTSSNANANANATEERVVALRDLPEDVRASLPPLTVAGATYSENPASRMLIINGKLVHEGDKLTPELTLQQIRLRTAILSYRGTRFSISY
jgi:general secretion pathway protein B